MIVESAMRVEEDERCYFTYYVVDPGLGKIDARAATKSSMTTGHSWILAEAEEYFTGGGEPTDRMRIGPEYLGDGVDFYGGSLACGSLENAYI